MVTELWGCCRDPLAFGYFRVPLPKIRVYLQDGWRLLSETYSLALTKKLWLLDVNLVYQVPGNNLNLLVIIISIFNFQIFSKWFHVPLYQFQDLHRCHSFARNVFESEDAGEVTIESCPAFSGLSDDISENPGQVHCCWEIPVFNGPHPPQLLKTTYISLFLLIHFHCF